MTSRIRVATTLSLALGIIGLGLNHISHAALALEPSDAGGSVTALAPPVDPGCEGYQAWTNQSNPRSDVLGTNNSAYPEANATYWTTLVVGRSGTTLTIRGRYPQARYMSLQTYDENRNVLDAINDVALNPDPGQNNPFRTGFAQGTYTAQLVFGRKPMSSVPANTLYTGGLLAVGLVYRVYYSNNPDNLAGTSLDPILPELTIDGVPLSSCPPRPIVLPEDALVWGRLDNGDYMGTKPPIETIPSNPPRWTLVDTSGNTPYYPSEDNSYMAAAISRDYLQFPYNYELVVMRFRTPTFPDTQAGVAPYAPAQVRFWSVCQNEPLLTSVVRCSPDNAHVDRNGFATYVISDPSKRPPDDILNRWGARWIAWGALQPNDVMYDIENNALTSDDGLFYYGLVLYRQTMADPGFTQSIENVSQLALNVQKTVMGAYWPTIGYCTRRTFQLSGAGCIEPNSRAKE
jgi:hypothetical protein